MLQISPNQTPPPTLERQSRWTLGPQEYLIMAEAVEELENTEASVNTSYSHKGITINSYVNCISNFVFASSISLFHPPIFENIRMRIRFMPVRLFHPHDNICIPTCCMSCSSSDCSLWCSSMSRMNSCRSNFSMSGSSSLVAIRESTFSLRSPISCLNCALVSAYCSSSALCAWGKWVSVVTDRFNDFVN